MILGQVGKQAHGVRHAVHAVQIQRVGGDFHHHVGAAGVAHLREEPLQLKGFRRGALRGDHFPADHVLIGADEAHFGAQRLLQHEFQQIGAGGLAVGAGDAHHGHGVCRVAEEVGAQHRQRAAGVFHLHVGRAVLGRTLAHHGRSARGGGFGDKVMAVHGVAGHGNEQVARADCAGIVADVPDLHIQIRRGGEDPDPL